MGLSRVVRRLLPPEPEVQGGASGDRPFCGSSAALAGFRPDRIHVRVLFSSDRFAGALIGFEVGQTVPEHHHQHKDEVFDVVAGEGEILVDTAWRPASPGDVFYVPAGTRHALRNSGATRWIVRETVRERIYAGAAILLVLRALRKRVVGR